MSQAPFMPLWVSDFLGDTLDLDAAEIGAYMLLLMAQWNRDGNSLPDDQEKLRRVARCGRNWSKVWGNVERYFSRDDQGIYSKRLRLEAQNVASKREVNARNGSLGGKAKSLKSNNAPIANATNSLKRNPSIPEPEPNKDTTLPDAGAMCAALGVTDETKTPGLLSLSDPIRWIENGCDMEKDILPTLRQMATRGKAINSWAYCTDAVFAARDRRLAPAPDVIEHSAVVPFSQHKSIPTKTERMLQAFAEAAKQ